MILTADNTTRAPHRIRRCPDTMTVRTLPVSELRAGDQLVIATGVRFIVDDEPEALTPISGWAIPGEIYADPLALVEVRRRG